MESLGIEKLAFDNIDNRSKVGRKQKNKNKRNNVKETKARQTLQTKKELQSFQKLGVINQEEEKRENEAI